MWKSSCGVCGSVCPDETFFSTIAVQASSCTEGGIEGGAHLARLIQCVCVCVPNFVPKLSTAEFVCLTRTYWRIQMSETTIPPPQNCKIQGGVGYDES